MYAVITSGGKQYKIGVGETVKLEKIDLEAGQPVTFDQVLLTTDGEQTQIGSPYLQDTKVNAEVVQQGRGEKIRIIKFRRRKHSMKQAGHRQAFTEVKITGIQIGDQLFQTKTVKEKNTKKELVMLTEDGEPRKSTRQRIRKPAEIAKGE